MGKNIAPMACFCIALRWNVAQSRYLAFFAQPRRMRTIAIVEDDPSTLQSLSRLLIAHGFRVEPFLSAEAFLKDAAHCEATCLLADIQLGGISGIELQRQLMSSGNRLPVILMTANDSELTRRQADAIGCIAYLKKPFLAKLLLDAIDGVA